MRKSISPFRSVQNFDSNEYKISRIWPLCPPYPLECEKPPLPSTKPLYTDKNHPLCCGNCLSPHTLYLVGLAPQQVKRILVRLCFKYECMGILVSLNDRNWIHRKTIKKHDWIRSNISQRKSKEISKTPWTSGNGNWRGTTRTLAKVCWLRPMETTQEAKVAHRSPGMGKGRAF